MIISGKNSVFEILNSNKTINKVLISDTQHDDFCKKIIDLCKKSHIRFDFVPKVSLDKLSPHHQGYVADVTDYKYFDLDDIKDGEAGSRLIVILDGIEDVHNFGSILRVCDCAGVNGIIISDRRSVAVNDTVYKTSAGAISHVKVCKVGNINDSIRKLKQDGFFVFGAEADGESIYKTNLTGDICLVMGSEGEGISVLTRKLCDGIISLPMFGKVNSLNVSCATSAVLYEAIRQREGNKNA